MLFDPYKKEAEDDAEHTFPHKPEPLKRVLSRKLRNWAGEYLPLFEAGFVAISAHILAFPIIWFLGWAMPWPKSPEITTIIEFDLSQWPEMAVPIEITDIYESQKQGGHAKKKKKK